MNFALARFLAWRYIFGTTQNNSINFLSKICFFALFIGTIALALEIFIMEGFEQALANKMQSIYPALVINAPIDSSFEYAKVTQTLEKKFPHTFTAFAPAHIKQVVVQSLHDSTASAVTLKAIDPVKEQSVSSLAEKLIDKKDLSQILALNTIIIGKKLADYHDLAVGDSCTLLFTQDDALDTQQRSFESASVTIGGIIQTGIIQYDKYMIICSLETMQTTLQEDAITSIGAHLAPGVPEQKLIIDLEDQLAVDAHSWKTLYPALVSATKLEKYVMFFLLALITLIASTNIISLLFMHINNKKADIAILKTLGLDSGTIVAIFVLMGTSIAFCAGTLGLICAFCIGTLLQRYPFISLPDAYYVTQLPVSMHWTTFVLVLFVVVLLSTLAAWFSAHSTRSIGISQTLRFEG